MRWGMKWNLTSLSWLWRCPVSVPVGLPVGLLVMTYSDLEQFSSCFTASSSHLSHWFLFVRKMILILHSPIVHPSIFIWFLKYVFQRLIFQLRDWAHPLAERSGYVTKDTHGSNDKKMFTFDIGTLYRTMILKIYNWSPLVWWFYMYINANITGDHFKSFWYAIIRKWFDPFFFFYKCCTKYSGFVDFGCWQECRPMYILVCLYILAWGSQFALIAF